jgi:tetratricopeptide (TPR) repeat protein
MIIINSSLETPAEASRLSAKAQYALEDGDTVRSQELRREAANILEQAISRKRKQSDKHMLRFLAATQYYLGGHYQEARRLCQKIERKLLPVAAREVYDKFLRDVKERSSPEYAAAMREKLAQLWEKGNFQHVIELLKEHPFVVPAAAMALVRANYCANVGNFDTAASFYSDALKFGVSPDAVMLIIPLVPVKLLAEGRLTDAAKLIEPLLAQVPVATVHAAAALLCFYQALETTDADRRRLLWRQQVTHCDEAWEGINKAPAAALRPAHVRQHMTMCLVATAIALRKLGQLERALECFNQALALDPSLAKVVGDPSAIQKDGEFLIAFVEEGVRSLPTQPAGFRELTAA